MPARASTTGTKAPTTRSAIRCVRLEWRNASRTDRQICAQRLSSPRPLLRISNGPSRLMLPARTRGADCFRDLSALAGDHRVIGMRATLHDQAIDWNALAGPEPGSASLLRTSRTGRRLLLYAFDHHRRFAFGGQQRRQIARRPRAPCRIEVPAEREQHQHHRGGIEIERATPLEHGERGINVGGKAAK